MTHVVCLGDVLVDVHAALHAPLAHGSDTPAAVVLRPGGAGANVAAWLAACGATATFLGRVGDDLLGHDAVAQLRSAGVQAHVVVDPSRPTGTCIVLVDTDGERTMIPSAGANDAEGELADLPARADWLYVSGYTLLRAASRPAAIRAMEHARSRHWSVAVDAASAGPLADFGAQRFLDAVGSGATLFANAVEARVLVGSAAGDDAATAAQALALRCGQAVVKRGAAGAVWSDAASVRSVAAVRAQALDTTGAGDAFAAGYLAGGPDVAGRLAMASASAARAVGVLGARPAQPA